MYVENMTNNKGNMIANQFRISDNGKQYFQSYHSTIVKIENGQVFLDSYYWDYSRTTSRYRNMFLNETTKETQAKIDSGEYILTNLN